ncbi:low molecular weight phosphatase family protein [Gryllotalpicola koreensis]|uniref:Low molecular weight phosphatase family protein n=1 Tax=Gryllotalpicola koreensis TaxID=993086 RepID=A0ABP8A0D6_9MICO
MTDRPRFRVLAICSGNVCRSPFLELLLARALAGRADLEVASAGTIARPRMRMTDEIVRVAARYGIPETDARAHRAARLDEAAVADADLVLGLTREHRAAAVQLHPRALRYAFTLREFARLLGDPEVAATAPGLTPGELVAAVAAHRGGAQPVAAEADDIRDPIGLPQAVYDEVGAEIAAAAEVAARALAATREATVKASESPERSKAPSLSFSFRRL